MKINKDTLTKISAIIFPILVGTILLTINKGA